MTESQYQIGLFSAEAKAAPRKKGSSELSNFAYVDKNGKGHLPLNENGKLDKGHVDNAAARLEQTDFSNPPAGQTAAEAKAHALKKIRAAQKHFGEKHSQTAANSFSIAINDSTPGLSGVPEWVMLIPAGTFTTRDGRGPFTMDDPDEVIAATSTQQLEAGLPFDINHSTDFAAPNGGASPAAGWIKQLENRSGEIWGRVEWTALGKESLSRGPEGEPPTYRYISPVFTFDEKNHVLQLLRAALTNNPNLYDTVICARTEDMDPKDQAKIEPLLKDAKLVEAARFVKNFTTAAGGDYALVATMAKKGTPIEEAFGLLKEQADASGISIAHFIDALVDMAKGQAESPDKIDENDMPDDTGSDTSADESDVTDPFEAKAKDLSANDDDGDDDSFAKNEEFAVECKAAAEQNSKKPRIVARLNALRADALERCSKMAKKIATHEVSPEQPDEGDISDADMAERCERMADEHEKAGRSEDAKFCRAMAAKHRSKHEEASREEHRKEAAEAATAAAKAATETMQSTLKQLSDEQARATKERAKATVEQHIKEGRLAPAQRDWALSYSVSNPADYAAFVAKQPVMKAGADGSFTQLPAGNPDVLTENEQKIARNIGVSAAKFITMRKGVSLNGKDLFARE